MKTSATAKSGSSTTPATTKTMRPTPFDRLGGGDAVEVIVSNFYERVLADPVLSPFFAGSDMEHLRAMQREYVTIALGGPTSISPTVLRDVHAGRGIRAKHFLRFLEVFMDSIRNQGLDEVEFDAVLDRMAIAASDVLDSPTEAG